MDSGNGSAVLQRDAPDLLDHEMSTATRMMLKDALGMLEVPRGPIMSKVPRGVKRSPSATTDEFRRVEDMGHADWLTSIQNPTRDLQGEGTSLPLTGDYTTVVKQLRKNLRVSSTDTSKQFLPLGQLLEILRPSVVDRILRQHFHQRSEDDVNDMISKIYDDGAPKTVKILGTLMISEKTDFLPYFTSNEVTDDMLPLQIQHEPCTSTDEPDGRLVLKDRDGNHLEALGSADPENWTYYKQECFVHDQMSFCAPFFSIGEDCGDANYYELPKVAVLPFLSVSEPELRSGGFGLVTKVQIDPSHFHYHGMAAKPTYIAIKTLHHYDKSELYPNEVDALSRRIVVSKSAYDNVSRLLFSFRQGDRFSLAFDWADGNLRDLWATQKKVFRPRSHAQSRWFFKECLGLATGLYGIHNLRTSFQTMDQNGNRNRQPILDQHGRHGDIKPANILYYPCDPQDSTSGFQDAHGGPRLVLADFGCTQFSTLETKSHDRRSKLRGWTPAYRAPEGETMRRFGPKCDIWALGCVFLEHAAVFIEDNGDEPIETFYRARIDEETKFNQSRPHWFTDDTFFRLCILDRLSDNTEQLCKAVVKDTVTEVSSRVITCLYFGKVPSY